MVRTSEWIRRTRLWLFVLLAATSLRAVGQPLPPGPEFQINDFTTGSQSGPTVAARSDGSFVVSWFGPEIAAKLFDAEGEPLGAEFQINDFTTGGQLSPDVAALGDETFVVVWASDGSGGDDSSGSSVQARRFGADGSPLGGQFQVNTYTTDDQDEARVGAGPDGGFVVAWTSVGSPGDDSSGLSIQARRFDPSGTALGDQFQVNTALGGYEFYPEVAVRDDGEFLVVWNGPGPTDPGQGILGRRYDSAGVPSGADFQVNSYSSGQQERPTLAFGPDGGFVVAWSGSGLVNPSFLQIVGRRFDSSFSPLGDDFEFNSYTTSSRGRPSLGIDTAGRFVVTWEGRGNGTDTDFYGIHLRGFKADATPIGDDFQVNTYTLGYQYPSELSVAPNGSFLVVWRSDGSSGSDTSGKSIQGRLFSANVFSDGFESGDTTAWSVTVP